MSAAGHAINNSAGASRTALSPAGDGGVFLARLAWTPNRESPGTGTLSCAVFIVRRKVAPFDERDHSQFTIGRSCRLICYIEF